MLTMDMATISVPLSSKEQERLDSLVARAGSSRADIMRRALETYDEEQAILDVVISMQEIKEGKVLRGDLKRILLA